MASLLLSRPPQLGGVALIASAARACATAGGGGDAPTRSRYVGQAPPGLPRDHGANAASEAAAAATAAGSGTTAGAAASSASASGADAAGSTTTSGRVNVADENPQDQPGAHVGAEGTYDPWQVLGLQRGASAHDIRVRYHDLMKQYHPHFADPESADVDKWTEVDRAHGLITQAPKVDTRFSNHMTDGQRAYYAFLPEWMARNVDDKPRYWSWFRHRVPPLPFWCMVGFGFFIAGRLASMYPAAVPLFGITAFLDLLFGTTTMPIMVLYIMAKAFAADRTYTLAWLMSPKGFMQRDLYY
jgi:hypothetical protein